MINRIDFSEIKDGDVFEDLVADYFRDLQQDSDNNISDVQVLQSGIGVDGGRDILVAFDMNDDIEVFKRKWVVQCKFHDENISASRINSVNIPTLIHSYGASGYLLICRKNPTSGLTDLFERLNKICKNDSKIDERQAFMREDLYEGGTMANNHHIQTNKSTNYSNHPLPSSYNRYPNMSVGKWKSNAKKLGYTLIFNK